MTAIQMLGWMLAWGGITFGISVAIGVILIADEDAPGENGFWGRWAILWFVAAICVAAKYLIQ